MPVVDEWAQVLSAGQNEEMAGLFEWAVLEQLEAQCEARGWLEMVSAFCESRQAPEGAKLKLYSQMLFNNRIPVDAATYLVFTTAGGIAARSLMPGWEQWPDRPQVLAPILRAFAPEWANVLESEDFGADALKRFGQMMQSGQVWAMPAPGRLN